MLVCARVGWTEANRTYLSREIDRVGALLADSVEIAVTPMPDGVAIPSLVAVERAFRLSPFERDVLIMCAGAALEQSFTTQLGGRPTFARAMAALPGAHLDAVSPSAPLRMHRLVLLASSDHVLGAPLALDERIFHFLVGAHALDERLVPLQLAAAAEVATFVPSQLELVDRLARLLRDAHAATLVQVFGGYASTRAAIVHQATITAGLTPLRLRASGLHGLDLEAIVRACERETLLAGIVPVIEVDDLDPLEATRAARVFAETTRGLAVITAVSPIGITRSCAAQLELPVTTAADRRDLWRGVLGADAERLGAMLTRLADCFRIEYADIAGAVLACDRGAADDVFGAQLWAACLERSRPRLDDLARRVVPTSGWDDLVLPANVTETLHEIGTHLLHRHEVLEKWGFGTERRGHAITALFAGPSGTGKTLAAEVIAREANLDLYHVDLSQVVDKYVGETEKRLRRIFDSAEQGGAIILFDEADALFGKRADVERATDRWANLEVSYLLQRMESYNGLAILTTNAKDALDNAFLRRLRFVATFPFPDATLRLELWRRAFPAGAPTIGIDLAKLARLQLTGANIKSVAIRAAFQAAGESSPITLKHVLRAARSEYAKLEVPFPEAETRTWTAMT